MLIINGGVLVEGVPGGRRLISVEARFYDKLRGGNLAVNDMIEKQLRNWMSILIDVGEKAVGVFALLQMVYKTMQLLVCGHYAVQALTGPFRVTHCTPAPSARIRR